MVDMGRLLMIAGGALFVVGLLLVVGARIPGFGNLPGDIHVQRDGFTFYAPLGTMIVISIVLTILLNVIIRLFR
jgi:hypothetical protein